MQKKQYCFILNNHFCSIAELQGETCSYISGFYFDQKNQVLQREQLNHHLNELNLPVFQADELSIAWVTEHSCLLPSSVYDPSLMKEMYLNCYPDVQAQHELDSNRLSSLSVVNLYELPHWIKAFFVLKFPKVVIRHHQSIDLIALQETKPFFLTTHIQIFPEMMSMNIMEKSEILFSNSFQTKHQNDIIYYLGFTIQQLKLEQKKGKIIFLIHPMVDFCSETELKHLLKTISTFDHFEIHFDSLQLFKSHQFCV